MAKPKFLEEFKKFALRGNVIDLAVGVIIGGAFQKIVTSVVNDLIMPLVGLMTGGVNFNDQFLILKLPEGVTMEQASVSLETAKNLGVTLFYYRCNRFSDHGLCHLSLGQRDQQAGGFPKERGNAAAGADGQDLSVLPQ